jgi:hypothetical protein
MLDIEKVALFLTIPFVLQKYSQTYQTLLDMANEDIYHHFCHLSCLFRHKDICIYGLLWYVGIFVVNNFLGISAF